jgi:hypothetical protein
MSQWATFYAGWIVLLLNCAGFLYCITRIAGLSYRIGLLEKKPKP